MKKYCLDCNKLIYKDSTRCKSCARKGKFNHKYKHGLLTKESIKVGKKYKLNTCTLCSTSICNNATICKNCYLNQMKMAKKIRQAQTQNYCSDCNIEITKKSKRCKSCSRKGTLNHFYGKHFTEISSLKLSEAQKSLGR